MVQDNSRPVRSLLADKLKRSLSGPIPRATPRRVHGRTSFKGKATAVVGMRRAGKTTFLHQNRVERERAGADRHLLPFLSFEDERLADMTAADLHPLVEEYYRLHPETRGRTTVTWCFDEIQVVPGWEKFVRRLLDEEKVDVFLSGSSATLLSREIATSMRGRAWEVLIHPFSFAEYLDHVGIVVDTPDALDARGQSAVEKEFATYLTVGGFPEAQGLDVATRHRLLLDYVDVAMMRDVVERHEVTQVAALRWMVRHLLGNAAGLFSVEKFHGVLRSRGLSISRDTVHALLSHLEDAFLVRLTWLNDSSERRRMVNPRKAFPVDPGLIPVFDRSGKSNLGHALETVVFLELERRGYAVGYVKTTAGHEVDFIARHPGGDVELIQVTADAEHTGTAERELRALLEAGKSHPEATRRLLALTRDRLPRETPPGIQAQAAWEWLLTK
jgi:predicted AAA+ superfamily ATPase